MDGDGGGSGDNRPHFILVPFMSPGHMIPMISMARALAENGAAVTLVTTPANLERISPETSGDRENRSITYLSLPFPSAAFGLPESCESLDLLPSRDLAPCFLDAAGSLRQPLTEHLLSFRRPSCIISDSIHSWTLEVARQLGVPRLIFHGFGCFGLLCLHSVHRNNLMDGGDEAEAVVIPGMPDRIQMTRGQLPGFRALMAGNRREERRLADAASDGVVVNSFDELEPGYRDWYEKAVGLKVWTIGPLIYGRNGGECLSWLSSKEPGSVIYVAFGSLVRMTKAQIEEIGLGLQAAGCRFVWAVRAEVGEWIGGSGFGEEKGMLIRGWAPQEAILGHEAVGGFMTHCGWNSTLEAVAAGVPMATWPHFAEQFANERLVVDVLRIGVAVGAKRGVPFMEEGDAAAAVMGKEEVEAAVRRLMGGGEEGEGMRKRAKELREKASRAVHKGGSSYENLMALINFATSK